LQIFIGFDYLGYILYGLTQLYFLNYYFFTSKAGGLSGIYDLSSDLNSKRKRRNMNTVQNKLDSRKEPSIEIYGLFFA